MLIDGVPVGEAVSVWVVAELESRRMLRPKKVSCILQAPVPETVKDREVKLIHPPKEREFVYTKTVRYSDLDINGHMNNTKYADVMMDALEPEKLQGCFISEMQLNFARECLPEKLWTSVGRRRMAVAILTDAAGWNPPV